MQELLAEGYTTENVWESEDQAIYDELTEFLLEKSLITDEERARTQAISTVVIARGPDAAIAAQMSATNAPVKRLISRFWIVSAFVAEDHRDTKLDAALNEEVKQFFEARYLQGRNPWVLGLFVSMQGATLQAQNTEAILPGSGYVFVGLGANQEMLRVYYFKDAQISQER